MPTDTRTPAEIERDIERERAQLGDTIEELQDRFSPETILREVGRGFREHGGDIGTAISRSVKENPVALALTGVGLAWMMFGRSYSARPVARLRAEPRHDVRTVGGHAGDDDIYGGDADDLSSYDATRRSADASRRAYDTSRRSYGPSGGSSYRSSGLLDSSGRVRERSAYSDQTPLERRRAFLVDNQDRYPSWASHSDDGDDDGRSMMSRAGDAVSGAGSSVASGASRAGSAIGSGGSSAMEGAGRAGSAVASGASAAGSSAAAGASSAGSAISSGASSAAHAAGDAARGIASGASGAASAVSDAAGHAYDSLGNSYRRLHEGTEHMSEAARERIVSARASALAARDRAMDSLDRNWRYGRDTAADFYEDQPLVVGALAVAIGAAIAGALPRTRYEDDAFGEQSDWLFDEAERIYHDERAKLERVAGAAMDEAKSALDEERSKLDESGKDAVKAATEDAKAAAKRVSDKAAAEADKQKLGKPGEK